MKGAYYNENDPFAAEWLRVLMFFGHIAQGDVDERSIEDVCADDLRGYAQHHFFAGIGVWSYALRRAGWPDERPIWTGSCPCQPFSSAGKGSGFDDERHLWPAWAWLLDQCRPGVVLGEQVASKDGRTWFDAVSTDLEGMDYACGATDFCAAGVGAPHIRQRLYWLAHGHAAGLSVERGLRLQRAHLHDADRCRENVHVVDATGQQAGLPGRPWQSGRPGDVADAADGGHVGRRSGMEGDGRAAPRIEPERLRHAGEDVVGNNNNKGLEIGSIAAQQRGSLRIEGSAVGEAGLVRGFWRDADWIYCRDGKYRPVESGTFPLVTGASARVGRLRGYGNAVNAEQAQTFIEAVKDVID